MLQPELLIKVLLVLRENFIDYMVTGSVVSSIQGEPRATHDVDVVINITPSGISFLLQAFSFPEYYLSEAAAMDAIRHNSMFNLLNSSTGDKVDFWILTKEPFDQSRFQRRYEEKFPGLSMYVSAPEDTIVMKLRWAELCGGSAKQFTDALRVYELQFDRLDLKYIESWIDLLDLRIIWNKLVKEAKPIRFE
jgi:hypothetical protein